jgi:hypothetical protein
LRHDRCVDDAAIEQTEFHFVVQALAEDPGRIALMVRRLSHLLPDAVSLSDASHHLTHLPPGMQGAVHVTLVTCTS